MIRFDCDYAEGCHPSILNALLSTNDDQTPGYGEDLHCDSARALIRQLCQAPDTGVHFLVGGTQANSTVISAALRPHQGVLCASAGHINCHESGAIESTGHKVLPLPSRDGKLTADQIDLAWQAHWEDPTHEHMVQPGLVYLSQPTETGLVYTFDEMEKISEICRRHGLILYIDGARLAYAIASCPDLSLPEIAELSDAFSIGGTKVGALFGEAVVITSRKLNADFRYIIKQRGGMLAKGRLLGIQFECLMKDNLYFELGSHGVDLGLKVREAFEKKGISMYYDSPTNQQFPVLSDGIAAQLSQKYAFSIPARLDQNHIVARFCTSWHTTPDQVSELRKDLESLPPENS